jgi:hypothetical protein
MLRRRGGKEGNRREPSIVLFIIDSSIKPFC